jgi:annexin A7/11
MQFMSFKSFDSQNIFETPRNDTNEAKAFTVRTYSLHIVPHINFKAEIDGRKLREALEGPGTNEQCIIDILTTRSNAQRQEIAIWYEKSFDRDLIDDLYNKFSGNFGEIIIALMTKLEVYLCNELHKSLTGFNTNEDALVEILCTKTHKEMTQLIEAYDNLCNRPLVEHLCSATGGYFRRLLTMIVTGSRDQSNIVDPILAEKQVAALCDTGKGKLVATDAEVFNRILSHDNFALLRKVFEEYNNLSGRTIEEAVVNEISGDLREAFLAISKL